MTALHEAAAFDAPATRELSVPQIPRQRGAAPARRHGAPPRQVRPTTGSHRRVPAPRSADTGSHRRVPARSAVVARSFDELVATELPTPAPAPRTRAHRLSRRPSVLLGALVAGGLVAGVLGFGGPGEADAEPTSVLAAQQALLGTEEDPVLTPMASISVAEAEARLEEVAASRKEREAKAAAEAEAKAAAAREAARPKTVLPVKGARLTSGYGSRWGTFHYGIDLAAPMHTPEYAAADGVVLRAGAASGFGLVVEILHENGDVTVYGHMDSITVTPGQYVKAGEQIALLGNRGQSTGPHLHFEVHRGGSERIDPIGWLNARGVQV